MCPPDRTRESKICRTGSYSSSNTLTNNYAPQIADEDNESASGEAHRISISARNEQIIRRQWRTLMQLQLPIDAENYLKDDDHECIELSRKLGDIINPNINKNFLIYEATVIKTVLSPPVTPPAPGTEVAKSSPANSKNTTFVPESFAAKSIPTSFNPSSGNILEGIKSIIKKTPIPIIQSQPMLPTVIVTSTADNQYRVFEPNSILKVPSGGGLTPSPVHSYTGIKIRNKDIDAHNSTWQIFRRFVCCKNEKHPLDAAPYEHGRRTLNSTTHIKSYLTHLEAKRIPQGRAEARATLIQAYRETLETLRHVMKIKDLIENATETLSYSKYYLERKLNQEELELTEKRSIIGSLVWVSTFCIQFINDKDVEDSIKADVKLRIEDTVGSSILLWSAMVHIIETTKGCTSILEQAVLKFVFTLKAPEDEKMDSEAPNAEVNSDKIDRLKRRKWKMIHAKEMKNTMEEIYYWQGRSSRVPRPQVTVFERDKTKGIGQVWQDLKNLNRKETLAIIIRSTSKLLGIIEDELTQLTNLDKAVQSTITTLDNIKKTKNLLESALLLERTFHSLHQFPNNLLKSTEVDDLKEAGRVVLDKLDDLNMTLESLFWIGLEAMHIVHICYEYIRIYYKWPLQDYDTFAPDNHKKYMELWAHNPEFKVAKPPESLREPIPFFHSSVYQNIMRTVILNINDRDICLGKLDETEPTAAIEAKLQHVEGDVELANKITSHSRITG